MYLGNSLETGPVGFSFYLSESPWRCFSTSLLIGSKSKSCPTSFCSLMHVLNIESDFVVPNQSLLRVLPGSWYNVYTLVCILRRGRVLNVPSLISLLLCFVRGYTPVVYMPLVFFSPFTFR